MGQCTPRIGGYVSEFVSPAAGPIALPAKVAPPSVLAPGVPSLAAFIDLMIGKLMPPAAKPVSCKGERQGDAETGKILPEDGKKTLVDPALAWLFAAPTIQAPQAVAVTLPQSAAALAKAVGLALPTPLPAREGPGVGADPGLDPGKAPALATAVAADAAASAPTPNPSLAGRGMREAAPAPIQMKSIDPQPIPLAITPPPATAALPALFALAMTPVRNVREEDVTSPQPATVSLSPRTDITAAVQPTGDAQRQSLDLGRQDWPQKMIDHIETLRDNANANDTSIRLKPEALGRVDVSLKTHTDGAVSVRFTAEQPATRTLLIDAAPQLTAAAEARGIRLSGTSVDLSGQSDQRPRPEVERHAPITNRVAPVGDESEAEAIGRIA